MLPCMESSLSRTLAHSLEKKLWSVLAFKILPHSFDDVFIMQGVIYLPLHINICCNFIEDTCLPSREPCLPNDELLPRFSCFPPQYFPLSSHFLKQYFPHFQCQCFLFFSQSPLKPCKAIAPTKWWQLLQASILSFLISAWVSSQASLLLKTTLFISFPCKYLLRAIRFSDVLLWSLQLRNSSGTVVAHTQY